MLAGATLGGGTTVNWCTSLRLPPQIAHEWAQSSGVENLERDLAPHYAWFERRLGIGPAAHHNANNRVILDGACRLGEPAGASPRNAAADCGDGCGYCGYGCAYGKKRSSAAALLPDLAGTGGAIYVNAVALRVDISGGRARGVVARQRTATGETRTFEVDANLVAVCAGALRTPGLLARSGVRHPLLGKRLFLHPVASAVAQFDRPIEAWRGPMQSADSDAFNYLDGNYGAKIEVAPAHPGLAALAFPWRSRSAHAEQMTRLRNAATLIALTRDRDFGSVDLDDEAYVRYRVSRYDGEHLLRALCGLVDIAFAGGAVRVSTLHARPIEINRAQWTNAYRDEFAQRLRRIGVAPNRQILFSAHQMGTAAMGADPARGVVGPNGRVWGVEGLIVADAAVFPQSSGVNPMLTIMAMAGRIAAANGALSA
ncbi:MAG TPA: GMC family oxidoreductase N-terminal domain-containing protein [Candidatus Cybelea sp.]|nr:GMC family oxidoreductase N-terminal domain-containing protein [Candidatus Cybelea sp.]